MTEKPQRSGSTASHIVTALRELISALDRRVPHVEGPGENPILQDAQMLRRKAVAQIEALSYDQEFVDAIMTDDGCPSPERETNMRSSCAG
jgi:hypothetical protein